jgi:drug/metabolite transporter (DMT)-like permease
MSRLEANALLLLAAFFWGSGNVAQKTVLEDIGPMLAIGLRSLIGFLVVLPFMFREARSTPRLSEGEYREIALVSSLFVAALGFQQLAYAGTTVTNASFLVNSTVVLTPLFAWLLMREMPNLIVLPAIVLAMIGVALMGGGLNALRWGDVLCLVSAGLYAVWIVLLARLMRTIERPLTVAALQFLLSAIVGLPLGLALEKISVTALVQAAPDLAVLGILSTGAAFSIQAVAQRWTPPSDAAIVMSAESVFGAAAAAIALGERLSAPGTIGAALILSAILLIQVPLPRRTFATRMRRVVTLSHQTFRLRRFRDTVL